MKTFWKITVILVMVGAIGMSVNMLAPNSFVFVNAEQPEYLNGLVWYRLDVWAYIDNVKDTWKDFTLIYENLFPTQWNWSNPSLDWNWLMDDLAYIANIFIMIVNLFLMPLKFGAWTTNLTLAILGLNITNTDAPTALQWIAELIRSINSAGLAYLNQPAGN